MTNSLVIKLKMSKIHLLLTLSVYAVSAFSAWHYVPYFWLSFAISLALLIHLFRFLPDVVLCNQAKSIAQITLEKHTIIVQKNDHSTQRYTEFRPVYQSGFLVIIKAAKTNVIIFKDAVELQSLSTLNRILNAER